MSNWIEIDETYINLEHIRWFLTYTQEGKGYRPTRYHLKLSYGNVEEDDELVFGYQDIKQRDRIMEQLKNAINQGEKNE